MTYRAIIENPATGKRRTLKLGRCSGIVAACDAAKARAPVGWIVYDVHSV